MAVRRHNQRVWRELDPAMARQLQEAEDEVAHLTMSLQVTPPPHTHTPPLRRRRHMRRRVRALVVHHVAARPPGSPVGDRRREVSAGAPPTRLPGARRRRAVTGAGGTCPRPLGVVLSLYRVAHIPLVARILACLLCAACKEVRSRRNSRRGVSRARDRHAQACVGTHVEAVPCATSGRPCRAFDAHLCLVFPPQPVMARHSESDGGAELKTCYQIVCRFFLLVHTFRMPIYRSTTIVRILES